MNRRMNDAFPPVDASFESRMERAFHAIREENDMRKFKNAHRIAVVAAILLLMTTAIGFATGLFQSAFSRMQTEGYAGSPQTDYEKLDGMANRQASSQTIQFSGASAELTLAQSYYNGEQLAIGWMLKSDGAVEFFEKDDPRFAQAHPTQWTETIDGVEQLCVENIDAEQRFPPETLGAIRDRIDDAHWAGVFWYDVWMGDGVWIPDAPSQETGWDGSAIESDVTRLQPATDRRWARAGASQRYFECETPLPAAARDQQTLQIECSVYMRPTWLCYEGEIGNLQTYIGYGETETHTVRFEIPRGGDYQETTYRQTAVFPNHTADISIRTTPIYAQISIENHVPEAWRQAWAKHDGYYEPPLNLDADCAFNYEIWVRRDGETRMALDLLDDPDGIERLNGQFVIPDGASEIILRPVYANTGAHADEDVVLEIG